MRSALNSKAPLFIAANHRSKLLIYQVYFHADSVFSYKSTIESSVSGSIRAVYFPTNVEEFRYATYGVTLLDWNAFQKFTRAESSTAFP